MKILTHPLFSLLNRRLQTLLLAGLLVASPSFGHEGGHDHAEPEHHKSEAGESQHHAEGEEAEHDDHGDHSDHEHGGHGTGENKEEHAHGEEGHDDHEEMVSLSPEVQEEFGIRLAEASKGVLHRYITLPGEIGFNGEKIAYVTPQYAGTILSISVRLADEVKKGQVLARLESAETLVSFDVKAPIDGMIVEYDLTPGQTVGSGVPLFTVADLSTVWADLRVYQRYLGEVRKGLPVEVQGNHNGTNFRGEIAYLAPTVDEHTRTGLARVVVDNEEGVWRPGEFVKGRIEVAEIQVDLIVPRSAVLTMEEGNVVFVQGEEGFESRPVQLGRSDADSWEILAGLQAGESIVVDNAISLKAEMGKGSFGGHHH
ncbi:efflux RND transporter periplasmic adaptor subunit [Puniceicoccus vermicola]|uniref:Efflux RND transporter periplasmic adaptor subunit n=1 Tax=Puniceicoccus vermicola TaxID=388746 RepID=A0A7X1AYS3_9BACT|nr:efflux RND transporter periplasmic adaptor subunit [Puniceicoccus vermicola]MBC2602259.1 efflux RND transporter periplasmic adaptor subunit [Puniceicoccus vermicola]